MSDNPAGPQGGSGQDNPSNKPSSGGYVPPGQQNPAQPGYGQPAYGQNQGAAPYGQNQGSAPYGQNQGPAPYGASYGQQPAGYPAGGNYPGQQGPRDNPGRTLGITGLILAFIPFLNPVGLILSIVALVKSRRAGMGNGLAVAGIIVGALATIILVLVIILAVSVAPFVGEIAELCEQTGPGPQVYQGQEIQCP